MKRATIKIICLIVACVLIIGSFGCAKRPDGEGGSAVNDVTVERGVKRFELDQVAFTTGMLAERFDWNGSYLKHLDMDRLLYWYRKQAKVPQPEGCRPYPDWENSAIFNGITLGHYLAACSMMYKCSDDDDYLDRVNYIAEQLKPCQKENGLIFAYGEERFTALENGGNVQEYGPDYYYISKTLYGLVFAYRYCGNSSALEEAEKLGAWICQRTSRSVADNTRDTMLKIEYGDIVYSLFELYDVTSDETLLNAVAYFTDESILESWASDNIDVFGWHANTAIPKAIGFALCFKHGMGEQYLRAAVNFWKHITTNYMYPNGGFSTGEGFGPLYEGANEHSKNPCETCTVYNVIRLSQYLYEITEDIKYLDYIERAALNGIAGSINDTGCKTYYQFMEEKATKHFHDYDGGFWCCTGTGMENFQRLLAVVGYDRKNALDINMFVSCIVKGSCGIELSIDNEDEINEITILRDSEGILRLRVPEWANNCSLSFKGSEITTCIDGYYVIKGPFNAGDKITYITRFRSQIEWSDTDNVFTLRYGPYQMVSLDRAGAHVSGNRNEGWIADPYIYKVDGFYFIETTNGIFQLKKYGEVYDDVFTTFFILDT